MIHLAHAAWTDVHELLARDPEALVLLPVGALEAHGPHLPLSTDVIIAEGMARRAAQALEAKGRTCAIAPSLVYNVTEYAAGFDGTAGVGPEAAEAYARGVCLGLERAGFRRIVVANAHLEPAHVEVMRRLTTPRVVFPDCTERRFARTLTDEFKRGACHAGAYETSLVLAERPDLVRDDRRAALPPVDVDLVMAMRAGVRTFEEAGAPEAYFGDPASASVVEGEDIFARLVAMVVTVVEERWP